MLTWMYLKYGCANTVGKYAASCFTSQYFGCMKPLIDDMVDDDQNKTRTMEEVIQQLDALVEGLGQWQSRATAAPRGGKYIQRKRADYISLGEEDCVFDNLFDYVKGIPAMPK